MLKGPFLDRTWMGQNPDYNSADIVMLGLPFDGTVSYRSGSRFGPEQIRLASWGLEEYSPFFDKDINDCNFHDAGDLEFPLGNTVKTLEVIRENVAQIYKDGKRVFHRRRARNNVHSRRTALYVVGGRAHLSWRVCGILRNKL